MRFPTQLEIALTSIGVPDYQARAAANAWESDVRALASKYELESLERNLKGLAKQKNDELHESIAQLTHEVREPRENRKIAFEALRWFVRWGLIGAVIGILWGAIEHASK